MTDTGDDSIPATATKIEINLSRLPQLFNSLDPSPFHSYRRAQESRRLRLLFRDGRIALLIGLIFLLLGRALRSCVFASRHSLLITWLPIHFRLS
jgi:hypothetical protein